MLLKSWANFLEYLYLKKTTAKCTSDMGCFSFYGIIKYSTGILSAKNSVVQRMSMRTCWLGTSAAEKAVWACVSRRHADCARPRLTKVTHLCACVRRMQMLWNCDQYQCKWCKHFEECSRHFILPFFLFLFLIKWQQKSCKIFLETKKCPSMYLMVVNFFILSLNFSYS